MQTNEIGHATLDLPGEALEPGVRLKIAASKQAQHIAAAANNRAAERAEANADSTAVATVELPVQPEPQIAYFLCASPVQQPDQQVPVAEWYFNAFTAKPAPPDAAQNGLAAVQGANANEPRPAISSFGGVANGVAPSQNFGRANTQLRASVDKFAAGEAANDYKSQAVVPPNQPIAVAADKGGNVYVADRDNHLIRLIDPSGKVSVLAGTGAAGFVEGPAASAQFASKSRVAQ